MSGLISAFFQLVNVLLLAVGALIVGVISIFVLKFLFDKGSFKKKLKKATLTEENSFLLVKISPSNEEKETAMDEFLKTLHRVIPNNSIISLEMASVNQFLSFYVVVPKRLKSVLESQLYAQYSEAEIEEVKDYLPDFENNTAFIEMKFKHNSFNPINTYKTMEEDILKSFSSILAKSDGTEKVFFQLVLKKVGSKWWDRGMKGTRQNFLGSKYDSEGTPNITHVKFKHELFVGKLRFAYEANDKVTAELKLNSLIGLLKSVKGEHNELKKPKLTLKRDLAKEFKARLFENGDFWTTTEAATLYHFPYKGATVSNVVNTTSKRAPAPDILPREGLVSHEDMSVIGETNYRNDKQRFGLKRIDRRRHLYVVGKTGSGKSKLLELLLISDVQTGQGCCILDPHGDLADEVLKYVPKERIKDVVYVNPADVNFPIGFNPLEPVADYQMRQHLSVFFISIFRKLLAFNWNARMEHLIRYTTLALLETPDSSILGIPRMLSDTAFRQRVIKQIQDPVVKSFWINEFSSSDQGFINEAVIPILNKVGQFTSNPVVRNMVGQSKNALDFEKFMNEGKIVIINVSKGKLGDENSALLGSMFITKIQQGALARANIPEEERRDFYFYVDEFQNFATDAFSSILSEARKYHLDLTIAHQYIAQLPEEVKATAFGNVGSLIVFGVGGDDAAYLAKEFAPVFTPDDMINLNLREMYVKMSVDGKLTTPFSARTVNVPKHDFDYSKEIIDKSRMTYAKNRVAVENEIAKWTSSTESVAQASGGEDFFPEPII